MEELLRGSHVAAKTGIRSQYEIVINRSLDVE